MEYGTIVVHSHGNGIPDTYTWSGNGIAKLDRWLLDDLGAKASNGTEFMIGRYKVRVVDTGQGFFSHYVTLVRVDTKLERLRYLFLTLSNFVQLINRRLLATARVWNLLDTRPGVIPQWRDLKIFRFGGIK